MDHAPRAVALSAPALDPPADMIVHAGLTADQTVHATDVDGDPLTFSVNAGPSYMTVTTTDPGTGSASGIVHLAPSLIDAGTATGIVAVYDGIFYRVGSFAIAVFPTLAPPTDMTINEGSTADQTLVGSDSDGYVLTFTLVSGPTFATVTTTSDSTGNFHLAPGLLDSGYYTARVSSTDGVATRTASLHVTVNDLTAPPVLAQPADMHGVPYTISEQVLTASDPDIQVLTFSKVSGPYYLSVGGLNVFPSKGYARLDFPTAADTGTVVATVSVSDGTSSDQKSFTIRVDNENHPPVIGSRAIDMPEGADLDLSIIATDPDGQRLFATVSDLARFMSVGTPSQPEGSDSLAIPIRLLPTYDDAGVYHPVVRVSDLLAQVTDTLSITVRDANPETSLRLGRAGVEHEYSAVDGTFTVSSNDFRFQATTGSGASWDARTALPWAEGERDYSAPFGFGFSVLGNDSTVPGLVWCSPSDERIQIKRVRHRLDGSILSLWATFQVTCKSGFFQGELRYQVQGIPITVTAPSWLPANTNQRVVFQVSASDTANDRITLSASGVPQGAGFLDFGGGTGAFGWTPGRLQAGDYTIRTLATSAGELADTAFTTL
ncbi:MAG TPA: hypothetical protein VEU09_04255, partial [Candidatus Binatia bacterium]|nr:hypothetical protein [Candidatus Binatia bacterium]